MEMIYEVYIKVSGSGFVTAVNSSAFLADTADWVKIDEGCGDKYRHAQGNYFPASVITDSAVYRYRYADGAVRECTDAEIAQQEAARHPVVPAAPRNLSAGEYITADGVLYKVTENIPCGERIIVGQNAVVTTVEEQLYELTKGE